MDWPSPAAAADWFVETARAAVRAGDPLDADAVRLLISLAPGDPAVGAAIDRLAPPPAGLAACARDAAARLGDAVRAGDEAAARETVTALETAVLQAYRPGHGLGRVEDDVAVALAMLAAFDVGADEAHLMMAEELLLGVLRRDWAGRARQPLAVNCEAAVALAQLAARTGKDEYRARALEVLADYATSYREHGVRAAAYVSALRMIS